MWFKNLIVYRLPAPWNITADQLAGFLNTGAFTDATSIQMESLGWSPVRKNGGLVHQVAGSFFLNLHSETKLLPASVINHVTDARAAELEEQQGHGVGRKQRKELKEAVTDELLPRAFSMHSDTRTWIDPKNGWLVVEAGSSAKAEAVLKVLLKAVPKFPLITLRTQRSPIAAMTDWLASDEAPAGFTVDQDTELRASGDSKASVRFVRHTLEPDDTRRHIEAGKQCTRLALTWKDRVSFTLTEGLVLRKIEPLDVLKEETGGTGTNDDERFDADATLMVGELAGLLSAVVDALGGEVKDNEGGVPAGAAA